VYKTKNPDAFTVGEVWSSTASIIPYVQEDRLDACFEFGLAGSIIDAVNNGDPVNLEQQLAEVQDAYPLLQYGTFLTNHDQDRVFSVLASDNNKMKLAASIYLTLPGIPFMYYGEEVGMTGTGADQNKRRPMQWSNASHGGFSNAVPWEALGTNYLTNNVGLMDADQNSLLNHYRKLIQIRNEQESLRRGQTLMVNDNENDVFSFARVLDNEAIIVVANMNTLSVGPALSLDVSSLDAGEYYVTELLSHQSMGKITVDANGGFPVWAPDFFDLAGRSSWILLLSIQNPITGISEPASIDLLKLIPNPSNGSFKIVMHQTTFDEKRVLIFTSSGRLFYRGTIEGNETNIRTDNWPAGIYFVQVLGDNGVETGKVIVNREP
jgi:hypothetical protein